MPRRLTLREIQLRELSILEKVTAWFDEHEIRYSLSGGTLLGAIRHGGFIPWDDDIDVCVPRPDYQRMIKLLRRGANPIEDIGYRLPGEKNYYFSFVKFTDPSTYTITKKKNIGLPLRIDVFPMDKLPSNPKKYKRCMNTFLNLRYILWTQNIQRNNLSRFEGNSWKRKLRWNVYWLACKLLGGHRGMAHLIDFHARCVGWFNRGSIRWGNLTWTSYLHDYADMPGGFDTQMHIFEGEQFHIMCAFDEYLRVVYGDYMTLPPEDERANLHNPEAYAIDD